MKRQILKLARPVLSPANHMVISRYYKADRPLNDVSEQRVLLFAPHVDDETIGAGGTLMKHAAGGAETHVAFLTDGSGSQSKGAADELVAARKKEAQKVKELLNLTSIDFFDEKDGQLTSDKRTRAWIKEKIETVQPDVIYAPVFVDCHADHIATAQLVRDTLEEMGRENITIRLYEINTLLPKEEVNCIVDISPYVSRKKEAIDVFQSQAIDFDGFQRLEKLKRHMVAGSVQAVETFLELTPSELRSRFDQVQGKYTYSEHFKQVNKEVTLLYAMYKNLTFKRQVYAESRK